MKNITIDDLLKLVKDYQPNYIEMIRKAYEYADSLHKGQVRQSGEPYITHPLNVAYILSEMSGKHADADTICAALLHDTLEDTSATKEEIANLFNQDVANLVDGVTKISKLNFSSKAEENSANTRKIITGITDDVRIIIIKLADRLHNMRTLQFKSEFKQKENALETMEIFVPLAYYIGAYRIKSELEDLSFKYLKPDLYKNLEEKMNVVSIESHACLKEMLQNINQILSNEAIPHEIKVRTKNIYGIYKRLCNLHGIDDVSDIKKLNMSKLDQIHDLLSLKIMVDSIKNCYVTLGLIHDEYHPVNRKFKDYICNPKTNLYQSLHTTVFGEKDRLVQTQIRTFNMDKVASFGLTAYWDIKSGDARKIMQEDLKNKFQFYRSLTDINTMFKDNEEFVTHVKGELFSDKIYVHNSKGEIVELPKGSNVIDFACYTGIENLLLGAKVNDELVSIEHKLKNKDRVVVLFDDLSIGYDKDMIDKANTVYAKRKMIGFGK